MNKILLRYKQYGLSTTTTKQNSFSLLPPLTLTDYARKPNRSKGNREKKNDDDEDAIAMTVIV